MIMDINEEEENAFTQHAPRFHTWGLRTHANSQVELAGWHRNVLESKGGHDYRQWWNGDPEARYLQLNLAAKVYKACVKYFEMMSNIVEDSQQEEKTRKVMEVDAAEYNSFKESNSTQTAPVNLDNSIDQEIQDFEEFCSTSATGQTDKGQDSEASEDLRKKVEKLAEKRKAEQDKQLPILHKKIEKSPFKKARAQDPNMPQIPEKTESEVAEKTTPPTALESPPPKNTKSDEAGKKSERSMTAEMLEWLDK